MDKASYTLGELANKLSVKLIGDPHHRIFGVDSLDTASEKDASFLANPLYREVMQKSKAGVICIAPAFIPEDHRNYLVSLDPSRLFQEIAHLFAQKEHFAWEGIHPTALVSPSAVLGEGVTIGPYSVIEPHAVVGAATYIAPHVIVGAYASIGEACHLYPFSIVRDRCKLGNRVILQSGAVIGSCGFGYTTDRHGKHHKLEQLGIVVIEDDVEIGANTTIDRARFKETIIRQGTKIDNLVQIAHNVEIGSGNLLAAQTGIAGSAKTGKGVMMGGQAGILGHVELEDGVMIATRGGVSKSLSAGKYRGSPAIPITEFHRQEVHVRKLPDYVQRIKALEAKLVLLEAQVKVQVEAQQSSSEKNPSGIMG